MRITTFGAATATALAAAAMLAVPATANAADTIDFNSGVKLSVTRAEDKTITATVQNPTGENIHCNVNVGDHNLTKTMVDLTRKYASSAPKEMSPGDVARYMIAMASSKVIGAGEVQVESKKSGSTAIATAIDDGTTKPEGHALCTDGKGKTYVAATVAGGLIGSIDFGGSLAGNTGSVSSLDFGGSLGL